MKTEILFGFICFVADSYGYFLSGFGRGSNSRFGYPSVGGGIYPSVGNIYHPGRYLGLGGGYLPPMGGYGRDARVSMDIDCNPLMTYVDQCQNRCYCRNNHFICPSKEDSEECDNGVMPTVNPCPVDDGYDRDCNTCFCLDIGQICSAKDCR